VKHPRVLALTAATLGAAAVLTAATLDVSGHDVSGHDARRAAAAAPLTPAPVTLTVAPAAPPPPELPDPAVVRAAATRARTDTGLTPRALQPLALPRWATAPTESRHPSVAPVGDALLVSSTPGGSSTTTLQAQTYKDAPLVLLELGRQSTPDGVAWVKVLLPRRPNGSTGFVRATDVHQRSTPWSIQVHQAQHAVLVFYGTTLVENLPAAVGAPATFTPNGLFFVDVIVDTGNPAGAYGKWILGLNGYSEVYDTFGDGDALIALHGTNATGSLGHSVSHGCVRLPNAEAAALAHLVPLGTPVQIST
jgi:lipoprotein-anchoring transpeptidase ErfK/SrfK